MFNVCWGHACTETICGVFDGLCLLPFAVKGCRRAANGDDWTIPGVTLLKPEVCPTAFSIIATMGCWIGMRQLPQLVSMSGLWCGVPSWYTLGKNQWCKVYSEVLSVCVSRRHVRQQTRTDILHIETRLCGTSILFPRGLYRSPNLSARLATVVRDVHTYISVCHIGGEEYIDF